jgi:predicted RNA-binding Zn ribbon-like protein
MKENPAAGKHRWRARRPGSRGELTSSVRHLLQAIYDLLRDRRAWRTFRTVDLRFDRDLVIADA